MHAPDLSPDEVGKMERRGWSGPLPDHGMHGTPPAGWKRHLVAGFGVIPSLHGDSADSSGSGDSASGGDSSAGGGGSGGDGGGF